MSKTYLENRIERYKKLQKRIKDKDVELYERRDITIPATLNDWLKENPEINYSAFCTQQTYKLRAKMEREDSIEQHYELYKEYKELLGVDEPLYDKKTKQTLDILKFYFSARNIGNEVGMEQARDTMEKVNPKVHKAIMDMELYILKHPEYADKIKNTSGFSEITKHIV